MKSGTLWVHCWVLAVAHLGAIRAVATVWAASEFLFFFCLLNNARFHRCPVGQISRNLNTTTSVGVENVRLSKKAQKFLTKLSRLATSRRHNSAMITDRREFTTKWSSTGCKVSILPLESSPWSVRSVQEIYTNFWQHPITVARGWN